MTQDMGNKILTQESTQKGRFFLCNEGLRFVLSLLLMMVVGVSGVWGHPFTLTTADDVTNGTETLYWIESNGAAGFYMIPDNSSNATIAVSTTNMPNLKALWYFMDAGTEGTTQYYYIVNKSTRKYLRLYLTANNGIGKDNTIKAEAYSDANDEDFKFSISGSEDQWVFYPKSYSSYWVNKKSGNVPYATSLKSSNYGGDPDANSKWKFVEENSVTWAHPFTNSTNSETNYYLIHNATANGSAYYISTDDDSDPYATISNANNGKRIWYFMEAASDNSIPNLKYYYIVNAVTGKYLKFTGTANGNVQTNSLRLYEHTGSETGETENRFQFMVLNAKGDTYSAYSIMPKLEISNYNNKHTSLSPIGANNKNDYTGGNAITLTNDMKIGLYNDRGQNNNYAHWVFVETDFVVEAPTITNNFDGTITLNTTTDGATIYYTTNGDTPDNTSTAYSSAFSLDNATVIKAIAYLGVESSDVTTYNVPQHDAPTISFNSATSQVTINGQTGATIYYTTDDSTPTASNYTGTGTTTVTINNISSGTTVKAIATHAGYIASTVTELAITQVATPTITINADNSVTITCATEGATIYYKTGGDEPTTENGIQGISIANILPSQGPIKAFAVKDGLINSNIATESNIPAKTIAVSSSNGSLTSEDPIVYNGTAHRPAFTIKDGETTISSEEYTSTYSNNTNAGTATITITDKEDGDYNVSGSFTFAISKVALTITAKPKTITYGDESANDGVTYSGFVNSESETTEGMFTGTLAYAYNYSQYGDVGSYAITPSGLTATNYDITFAPGTLSVNPKEVGLTWSETPLVYNGSEQTPNATATGMVNGDEIGVTVTGAQANAGTDYTATASELTGEKAGNYQLPDANTQTFTIGQKAMSVTADAKSKTYGDADPELTYTTTGLLEGDEVTGALARVAGENVGTYAITLGTLNNSNYAITFAGANFVITKKSLGDNTNPAENITIEITEANPEHVVVKQGGTPLKSGNSYDYTISTEGDANSKYYKVTVTGKNNYTGSFKSTFANLKLSKREGSSAAGGAATFVSNSDDGYFIVPDNMAAYIVTGINATVGTVEVEGPLDNIPEGVPVLLLSAVNANGFMVYPKADGTAPTGTNLLKVEATPKSVTTAEIYVLYKGEFVLSAAGTLPAGKIYLQKPGGGTPAPAILTIDWGATSGIEEIPFSMTDAQLTGTWYTLEGIKLNGRPTKRGLYLMNGKKMVVK